MAENDIMLKCYISDKRRFADLINGSIYNGKQIIKPENLTKLPGESDLFLVDKTGKKKGVLRYRDVVMRNDEEMYNVIFAGENQKHIHYAMPVRNMLYDALSYNEQVNEIKKKT